MNLFRKTIDSLSTIGILIILSACQGFGSSGLKVDAEWSDPEALVLHNGTVITATGEDPIENGVVLIQEGLITTVGPDNQVTIPQDATVIDVEGRTIMPGLIDARASTLLDYLEVENGRLSNTAEDFYLKKALHAGVTTIRALSWNMEKQRQISELRSALEAGGNAIPTIVIGGSAITHGEGSANTTYYPGTFFEVVDIQDTREATEQMVDLGLDQISLLMTLTRDSTAIVPDPADHALNAEQLAVIVEVAHNHGKRVLAQTIFQEEAEMVVEAGVDELMNWPVQAEALSQDLIEALVAESIPVVSGFSVVQPQQGDVRRFLDAGGILVFGTFAPNGQDLASAYLEFNRMFQNEMTPMEIIRSATIHAARALELGDVTGSLEPGKQADIIVIDGDLFDSVRDVRNVAYVINNGELVLGPEGTP